jgi:hypothetical protein
MSENCRDDEVRHRKFSQAAMFAGYLQVKNVSFIVKNKERKYVARR